MVDYLRRYTQNQSLLDMIAQHFFQDTPAFFALSYFKLYLDYNYPRGGTGTLPDKLVQFIEDHGGAISTDTAIVAVDPEKRLVTDAQGQTHGYRELIWAADLKTLYRMMDPEAIGDNAIKRAVVERQAAVADKTGGDSVFTVYLALDLDKSYFADRASRAFLLHAAPGRAIQSRAVARRRIPRSHRGMAGEVLHPDDLRNLVSGDARSQRWLQPGKRASSSACSSTTL